MLKNWFTDLDFNDREHILDNISSFLYYIKTLEVALKYNDVDVLNDKRMLSIMGMLNEYDFLLDFDY